MRLRVGIPHFFRDEGSTGIQNGYGSCRHGNRFARCMALARCLGSVLALNRSSSDIILNHAESQLEFTPASSLTGLPDILVEVHLFVCGDNYLQEVVDQYSSRMHIHSLNLDDPRNLPLATVRQLLDFPDVSDYSMYLEDDLVIQDCHYLDKIAWFCSQLEHHFVLMPHRREPTVSNSPKHLYVDGPIKPSHQAESVWANDETVKAQIRFWNGEVITFAEASNPHSGSFCISNQQTDLLRSVAWPPSEFVGPLETAATGTVMSVLQILKPTWNFREFLTLEHSNPSFLHTIDILPTRGAHE